MAGNADGGWAPTKITRMISQARTSTAPVIVQTDDGLAYAKTLGNPEGPSALTCELVGTRLAQWLGLPTFAVEILRFPDWQLDYGNGCSSIEGAAFVTRADEGRSWSGEDGDLDLLDNPEVLAGLVVFDTWTRNADRHCPPPATRENLRNVFFTERAARDGRYRLVAMDHSACFRRGDELARRHLTIAQVRDATIYGLFPPFEGRVTRRHVQHFLDRLRSFQKADAERATSNVPPEWGFGEELRRALDDFCVQRAAFVASELAQTLERVCNWPRVLFT